jgi:hypothetical protein
MAGLVACEAPEGPPAPSSAAPAAVAPDRMQRFVWDAERRAFLFEGQPLATGRLWTFEGATDGFVMTRGAAALMEPSGLRIVETGYDPILRSPSGLRLNGYRYSLVLVRLSRVRPGGAWDGALLYRTPTHGEAAAFQTTPLKDGRPQLGETMILAYDMARPKQGGDDWALSYIDQLRFDLDQDAGGAFVIRQIAVVQNPGADALGPAPLPKAAPAD